jgi:hypothetical protein
MTDRTKRPIWEQDLRTHTDPDHDEKVEALQAEVDRLRTGIEKIIIRAKENAPGRGLAGWMRVLLEKTK